MILQCIIPCIEGLLDEPHNNDVLSLLYVLAMWHSLAKLRMHTDTSIDLLDNATTCLGQVLRIFAGKTSAAFDAKETHFEYAARQRRKAATTQKTSMDERQPRTFNLNTIKLHSLGDYTESIRQLGTTDSYTTGIVSV